MSAGGSRRYVDATDDIALEELVTQVANQAQVAASATTDDKVITESIAVPASTASTAPPACPKAAVEAGLVLPNLARAAKKIVENTVYHEDAVREALSALAIGHLILAGPPGTGKTRLARELATAFGARLVEHTANPEWSVYDVIGSLTLRGDKLLPRNGLVTQCVIDCCSVVQDSLDGHSDHQAVWLLIDEINRAEIDRAFGPLFTALADPMSGRMTLDYFDSPSSLPIPRRFRIVATLNSFDARFVNSMSAALRRRFARVVLLPESNIDGAIPPAEFAVAMEQAIQIAAAQFTSEQANSAAVALGDAEGLARHFLGALRDSGEHGKIPFGTAQLIDSFAFAMSLLIVAEAAGEAAEPIAQIDRAFAIRLATSLESDSTRARVAGTFVQHLRAHFPQMARTISRLEAFLEGRD